MINKCDLAQPINSNLNEIGLAKGPFNSLPDELWAKIYLLLNKKSQATFQRTSRRFFKVSSNYHRALTLKKVPQNLVEAFSHLESLDLTFLKNRLSNEDVNVLIKVDKLRSLSLPQHGCNSDLNALPLASLDNLTTLRWHWRSSRDVQVNLTDWQLPRRLKELNIYQCQNFDDRSMEQLKNLDFLEALQFSYCSNVTEVGLKNLINLKYLRSLIFPYSGACTNDGLLIVKKIRHLRTLVVSGQLVSERGLKHIGSLTELSTLALMHFLKVDFDVLVYNVLQHCQMLQVLSIFESKFAVDESTLNSSIKDFEKYSKTLPILDISYTNFPDINQFIKRRLTQHPGFHIEVTGVDNLDYRAAIDLKLDSSCGLILDKTISSDKKIYTSLYKIIFLYGLEKLENSAKKQLYLCNKSHRNIGSKVELKDINPYLATYALMHGIKNAKELTELATEYRKKKEARKNITHICLDKIKKFFKISYSLVIVISKFISKIVTLSF